MSNGSSRSAHLRSGINSNKVAPSKFLRFCPTCIEKDEEIYGESYWHRLHQVPSILMCPKHYTLLKDSKVRTYEVNPQNYYPAKRIYCESDINIYNSSIDNSDIFAKIAEDVDFVLKTKLPSIGIDNIKNKYINKLRDQGLVSYKGNVDQQSFVGDFIRYYTPEVLEAINMMPDANNSHNWVSMMVRKHSELSHPVRHILLIRYLYKTPQDFYYDNHEKNIFGSGPFPCLNAAADHYLQNTICECKVRYSRNNNLYGVFSCDCGFIYEISGANNKLSQYKYSTIRQYGDIWLNKFRELVEESHLHFREIARILKIDLKTVRKYVSRLNLNTMWISNQSKHKFDYVEAKSDEGLLVELENYRQMWIDLIHTYIGYPKSKLKNVDTAVYNWLSYHDEKWFKENAPKFVAHGKVRNKVDWDKRDKEVKGRIHEVIKKHFCNDKKPQRITLDLLGKQIGMLYLLRNNLYKLPLTQSYIGKFIETKDEYRERKVKWTVKYMIDNGIALKEWKVRQIAGIYGIRTLELDLAIKSEIEKALRVNHRCGERVTT